MDERARTLILDDGESVRKIASAILEKKDYDIGTAENGKEAIDKSSHFSSALSV